MEEEKTAERDNSAETKQGMKKINRIIFGKNEDFPDDWTDFELTADEVKILKEAEDYIEKELIPSLSVNKKVSKKELMDDERPIKEVKKETKAKEMTEIENKHLDEAQKELRFSEAEITEIDELLKQKTKNLKLKRDMESEDKHKKLKDEVERKKKEEIDRLHE